jgi:hypothetical protein
MFTEGGLPPHAHAEILGHSIAVAEQYYLKVRQASFDKVRSI